MFIKMLFANFKTEIFNNKLYSFKPSMKLLGFLYILIFSIFFKESQFQKNLINQRLNILKYFFMNRIAAE